MPVRFAPSPVPAPQPMAAMNITPLIDVLLVLLIMLILTIPSVTHKVPLDLPQEEHPVRPAPPPHALTLDSAGRVALDGAVLPDAVLQARLRAIAVDPRPNLSIRADARAPYGAFDALVAEVRRACVMHVGMVGIDRFEHSF